MGQLANSSKNGENVSMTPWNDVGVSEKWLNMEYDGVCTYFPNKMGQILTFDGENDDNKTVDLGVPHFQTDSFTRF